MVENEDGNKSSGKSLHNEQISFVYSKSSGKKASVEKFDSPNSKVIPKERDFKKEHFFQNEKGCINIQKQFLNKQMINYPEQKPVIYIRQPQVQFVHNPYGGKIHN